MDSAHSFVLDDVPEDTADNKGAAHAIKALG